jgi:hypothetical protein
MSSSSGCSSYQSNTKYKSASKSSNPDYENLRELEAKLNSSGPIVMRQKKYEQFPVDGLGTFGGRKAKGRFDYV